MQQITYTNTKFFSLSAVRSRVSRTHRFAALPVLSICMLGMGCGKATPTWSNASKSPDSKMIATAKTSDESGPGTDFIQTTVFLNWTTSKEPATMVLAFSDGPSGPDGMKVWFNWITSKHLEISYEGARTLDFEAIRCDGIDISIRDLSAGTTSDVEEQF